MEETASSVFWEFGGLGAVFGAGDPESGVDKCKVDLKVLGEGDIRSDDFGRTDGVRRGGSEGFVSVDAKITDLNF